MNANAEIHIHNLGKKYKRYSNRWSRLAEWMSLGHWGRHSEHWALKDIAFDVKAGESVGVIGQNGAGKSTLLKILTGTTQPTEGSLRVEGRIAAILELGMGFHPDFTGRQNAVLSCQMAGLSSERIQSAIVEIQNFSELGDYFDQPLRVYSTGMHMRLAFSAATVVRPDVLIVDEALSVGDIYFQHKCIRRIRSFRQQGTTLLFVSHDPGAIKTLCSRAILLNEGHLIKEGSPDSVLDYYNAIIVKHGKDAEIKQTETVLGKTVTRSGSGEANIVKVDICDKNDIPARAYQVGDVAKIRCYLVFRTEIDNPTIGILIRDRLGNEVFGTNSYHMGLNRHSYQRGDKVIATFQLQLNLGCGNYSLSVALHSGDTHLENCWDWWDQCVIFEVIPGNAIAFIGLASLPVKFDVQRSTFDV
jgi:lipopolysaccharide transport system ATP-binding protein